MKKTLGSKVNGLQKGLVALLVIVLMIVAGCGNGNNKSANTSATTDTTKDKPAVVEPSKPTVKPKLTYWTSRNPKQVEELQTLVIPELLKEVDLEIVSIPTSEYENKLRIAIASATAPDIFDVDGVFTSNYAYTGALLPLDDYWDKADYDDYVQSSKTKTSYNGKIYAASLYESSVVLYYNKDHFKTAGITNAPEKVADAWTYEQYLEAAKKLTITDGSGQITQYGTIPDGWLAPDTNNEGASFTRFLFVWNNGGEVLAPDNSTAQGFLNSEKTIKALQAYQDYFQKYKVSPLETISKDLSGFETGKLSMFVHNIASTATLDTKYPDVKYGVMPLPKGEQHYGTSGGWNIGIYAKSTQPDVAWKVIQAITDKEGHGKFTEVFNSIPSRKSTIEAREKMNVYPLSVAKEMMMNPRARPNTPAYAEISPIFSEMMSAIAYGGDPKTIADKAVENIDKVLQKYK